MVAPRTCARQTFPDARRFDLLDRALYQDYLRDPGLFGRELALCRLTWREFDANVARDDIARAMQIQRVPGADSPD